MAAFPRGPGRPDRRPLICAAQNTPNSSKVNESANLVEIHSLVVLGDVRRVKLSTSHDLAEDLGMRLLSAAAIALIGLSAPVAAQDLCVGYGPQTPRDISSHAGVNSRLFAAAPPASKMNLCNIHTHTNAEHRGPEFSVFAGAGVNGGYQCDASGLTDAQLENVDGAFKGARAGETIEVHWVHTSCDVAPGEGLGACLSDACANPQLRVEAQVFLVVNDESADDFSDYAYRGEAVGGLHQAKAFPYGGTPVEFAGSTTGPSYDQATCSPLQVTWSVRPKCRLLDQSSLHAWAEKNPFNETKSHGVRSLVTAPELLSPISN